MKKKSLFLGGALMFAMTFSTTVLTSCHDDDKKYEEVEDPLRSQTAYYIAGTIPKQRNKLRERRPMPTVHWQEPP